MIFAALLLAVESLPWAVLPPAVRPFIAASEAEYRAVLRDVERDTAERLRRGEQEHFAYFVLQSTSFTALPPIEPALSAREFQENGGRVPAGVVARMAEFQAARGRPSRDARLTWFQRNAPPDQTTAYREAMRFLHDKELARAPGVYQHRGHSSDTRPDSSFTVWTALGVQKQLEPARRIRRVLVVGPGLDWAPRTAFDDSVAPRSYQPVLVHDALLEWQLAERGRLEVTCVDVNPRVIEFLRQAPSPMVLPETPASTGYEEFAHFARRALAATAPRRLSAVRMNILTERLKEEPFDLVVITNVLPYFSRRELALALTSIHSMLGPGGWLVHNEMSGEVESIARALRMPPVHGRTLEVARGRSGPLLDAFLLHRKEF